MTHPAKPKDRDQLRATIDRLEDDSFDQWRVEDQPYVDDDQSDMDLDEKLKELSKRLWKAGRLEEAKQRQRYEKPSERRREERAAQKHRAEEDKERSRWRGGVQT